MTSVLLSTAGFVDDDVALGEEALLVDEDVDPFCVEEEPPVEELDVLVDPPQPANISVAADVKAMTVSHGFVFTSLPP